MLRFLRNRLCPPTPSILPVLREIDERNISMRSFVYGGKRNSLGVARTYSVTLSFDDRGLEISAEAEGRTFDEALWAAWSKWPVGEAT